MILGLTGGIGSGKSTVARLIAARGFVHIDADAVCRDITSNDTMTIIAVASEFGKDILDSDCKIDRKKLASIVFNDKEKLSKLNSIVQTGALNVCLGKIRAYKKEGISVVFDVPLMFEAGWNIYCDKVFAVTADTETRIKRVMSRDNCTREDVIRRMNNQMSDDERKMKADFFVENNSDEEKLALDVYSVLEKYNIL